MRNRHHACNVGFVCQNQSIFISVWWFQRLQLALKQAFVLSFDALSSDVGRVMRAGIHISRARSPEAIQTMIQEHSAIVEAIRQRDPERAALSMRWHLSQGRMRLMP
jgi:GntR family transcriptional regulator, transcriptional repressor for pyruvate dehydrogenase complex